MRTIPDCARQRRGDARLTKNRLVRVFRASVTFASVSRHWRRRAGMLGIVLGATGLLGAVMAVPRAAADRGGDAGAFSPRPSGTIGHVGRWLTDAAGRVVLFHGINMVEKQPPYYPSAFGFNDTDAAWLHDNGLEIVRLGVLGTGLMPRPGHVDSHYLNGLARTVRELGSHHVYVLLDLHQDGFSPKVGSDGFPTWMTVTNGAKNNHAGFPDYYTSNPATQQAFQSLWDNERRNGFGIQRYVSVMVRALAQRFADAPNVVGYDIFNEPWPGTVWVPCIAKSSGCPHLDHRELDPLYARVDRAIRSVDPRHLLFVEPFVTFNFGTTNTNITLPGSDLRSGLSFHQYATSASGAAGVLSHARAWSQRTHGALLDTEWGATSSAPAITAQANQFDQALLPWIFWSFDGWIVHNVGLPPSGSNLVHSTVSALVRPYAFVVAGTPRHVSYNAHTNAFAARWSTTEPDGKGAPAGAVSTIEVPRRDYPSGYTAVVTGATRISQPCARSLVLATARSARSVSVSISPGGFCGRS